MELCPGRHGISPRHVARSVEVWRLLQTLATEASVVGGWHPRRYVDEGCGFIVVAMRVLHHAELPSTVPVVGATWVSQVARQTLFRRELRLSSSAGETLVEATQDWVFVRRGPDGQWRPARAPADLLLAFAVVPEGPLVEDPAPEAPIEEEPWVFEVWSTWMDPQGHVNHPLYVDWCDEALARSLRAAGEDPQSLAPVREHLRWRGGFSAGEAVRLSTRVEGEVSHHAVRCGAETRVTARLVRRRV